MTFPDMSYLQEPQWGNMQAKWEAQRHTHDHLCPNYRAWDNNCACKLIEQVREEEQYK